MQFQPDARSTKLDLLFALLTTKIYHQDSPQPSTCCGAVMPMPAQFPAYKQLSLRCAMSTGGLELSNRTAPSNISSRRPTDRRKTDGQYRPRGQRPHDD